MLILIVILKGYLSRKNFYPCNDDSNQMDAPLLDLITGLAAFGIFVVLIVGLPLVMPHAIAYLVAIIGFLIVMSGAGYVINDKIA